MFRGQASTEYLIVVAVVVVIALVAAVVLSGFVDVGTEANAKASKIYWRTAKVGLLDWQITESGAVTIVVRNNVDDKIQLTSVTLGSENTGIKPRYLKVGEKKTITGTVTGGTGEYAKDVELEYTGGKYTLIQRLEGAEPIVGVYMASTTSSTTSTTSTTTSTSTSTTTSSSTTSIEPGLVLHLAFENNLLDSSPNGNDGSFGGGAAPSYVTGVGNGKSIEFDGIDDTVIVADSPTLDGMSNLTLEAWVSTNSVEPLKNLVANADSYRLTMNNLASPNDKKLMFVLQGDSLWTGLRTGADLLPWQWNYLVAVYDSAGSRVYINGVLDNSNAMGAPNVGPIRDSATDLVIGGNAAGFQAFKGRIDEVRIYNRALSESEITARFQAYPTTTVTTTTTIPTPQTGLVLHLTFDGNLIDSSPNGNDGSWGGGAGPNYVSGKSGQAIEFNGIDDSVVVPDDPTLDGMGELSVEAWVYPNVVEGAKNFVGKRVGFSSTRSYMLGTYNVNPNRKKTEFFVQGPSYWSRQYSNAEMAVSAWNHVVGVFNGSDILIYRNGVLDSSKPVPTASISDTTTDVVIGGVSGDYGAFNGSIDEVRVYERALSETEVLEHYQWYP